MKTPRNLYSMALIGANIKSWREQRQMGLNELARMAGIDRGNLSKIEAGTAGASLETLTKIAIALKIPLAYLVSEDANVVEPSQAQQRKLTQALADHLIRHWQYMEVHQTGSHIILRTEQPTGQTLPIPAHKPLRTGTLSAILRMVSDHKQVSREDILRNL